MGCRMGQRDEPPKKPSNGQQESRNEAPKRLNTRSEDRNRAASRLDCCMQSFIATNFNSLLTSKLSCGRRPSAEAMGYA
jgi:hypothetical protein